MQKANDGIRRPSETISDELRKADKKLNTLLDKAKDKFKALNVEPTEEAVESETPVAWPPSAPHTPPSEPVDARSGG